MPTRKKIDWPVFWAEHLPGFIVGWVAGNIFANLFQMLLNAWLGGGN